MSSCDVCNSTFATKAAARQHKKDTKHCICLHCNKVLASSNGLQNHNNAVHCHRCPQCTITFVRKASLTGHQKSQRHCYCGDCNRVFGTTGGLRSHLQSSRHSTEFRCCDCDRGFNSASALDQHLRDKVHRRPVTVTKQKSVKNTAAAALARCSKCPRSFATAVALQQHLASLAHRPLGSLTCPAGASCKAKFRSPSAVLHHLESGVCPSGMDRDQMRILIAKYDTERLITKSPPDNITSLEGSLNEAASQLVRTPSSLSLSSTTDADGCLTPTSGSLCDWALIISQSPSYRCPFCPPDGRSFRDAKALQDHIQSAAHSEPFVYCPVAMSGREIGKSKATRKFLTVSGLAQHLESGACVGGAATFWKTVKYIEMRLQDVDIHLRLTQGGGHVTGLTDPIRLV